MTRMTREVKRLSCDLSRAACGFRGGMSMWGCGFSLLALYAAYLWTKRTSVRLQQAWVPSLATRWVPFAGAYRSQLSGAADAHRGGGANMNHNDIWVVITPVILFVGKPSSSVLVNICSTAELAEAAAEQPAPPFGDRGPRFTYAVTRRSQARHAW